MRPGEGPGRAREHYLQRPESSLRAHGTGKKRIIPKVMGGRDEEVGQEASHLVRKNAGSRARPEAAPARALSRYSPKEKTRAVTASPEEEETGKQELAAGPRRSTTLFSKHGDQPQYRLSPTPHRVHSPQGANHPE